MLLYYFFVCLFVLSILIDTTVVLSSVITHFKEITAHVHETLTLILFLFSAFEIFLNSLVKQEMSEMPRGVYFSAMRRGNLTADQGKTVAGIPSFMLKSYEKNKQPGLKPGLAGNYSTL